MPRVSKGAPVTDLASTVYYQQNARFTQHAEIVDGYTDLMVTIFGDAALRASAAPGMGSAPFEVAITSFTLAFHSQSRRVAIA